MAERGSRGAALAECLERRLFLNGAFAHLSANGTLIVTGDANANVITFDINPDISSLVRITMDAQSLDFQSSDVRRLFIDAGDGNDHVVMLQRRNAIILGGIGNDTITAGAGDDSIDAGAGNDVLDGGSGNDSMTSGDGNDTVDYSSRDISFTFELGLAGAAHNLTAIFSGQDERSFLEFHERDLTGHEVDFVNDPIENIIGTSKPDSFIVEETDNVGWTGPFPTLHGSGGADFFTTASDESAAAEFGDAGNDSFGVSEGSSPSVFGGSGDDVIGLDGFTSAGGVADGGPGTNSLDLSTSMDLVIDMNLYTNVQNAIGINNSIFLETAHKIIGTPGPNLFTFAPNQDDSGGQTIPVTILGGAGDDTIIGSNFNDSLNGGDGNDFIQGGGGNDTIHGGVGNDTLVGNRGHDKIFGDEDDDTIYGKDNTKDTLDGGQGNDPYSHDSLDLLRSVGVGDFGA